MNKSTILTRCSPLLAASLWLFYAGCAATPAAPDHASAQLCVEEEPAESAEPAEEEDAPPAPADPSESTKIVSTEVELESMGDKLSGVIEYPEDMVGAGPAVLIVHDAGPRDRHGHFQTELGLKLPVEVPVYQEFGENLARHGFVVMRFDKRTCVQGGDARCEYPRGYVEAHRGDLVAALKADIKAAAERLKSDPRVDPSRLFLLGHGQGAELALSLADPVEAAGLVLLSPSPYPIDEVILHQTRYSLAHLKARRDEAGDTTERTLLDQQLEALKASEELQVAGFKRLREDDYEEPELLGAPATTWEGLLDLHSQAKSALAEIKTPIMAVYGLSDALLPPAAPSTFRQIIGAPADAQEGDRLVLELADTTQFMVKIDDAEQLADISREAQQQVAEFLRARAF